MIRNARPEDASAVAELMLLAMGSLPAKFFKSEDRSVQLALLTKFIEQERNQYSYTNVKVFEVDGKIAGSLTAYDGGEIEILRQPFFHYIIENFHPEGFDMELESEPGEFYIDVIGVDPHYRNRGIGTELLRAAIDWAKQLRHQNVALLVELDNKKARKLYESLGFSKVGEKLLIGDRYEHLVLRNETMDE